METRRRASVSPQHFAYATGAVDRTAIIAASKQAAPRILTGPVVVAAAEPQFQPGMYQQLKRASLTDIPIYENIDGFPAIPVRGRRQGTPPPPPPPYTGPHRIVATPTPEQPYGAATYNQRFVRACARIEIAYTCCLCIYLQKHAESQPFKGTFLREPFKVIMKLQEHSVMRIALR